MKLSPKKVKILTLVAEGYTDKEIADILGVTEYEIANAMTALKEPVSMYEPIYNEGADTIYLEDQLEDKKDKLYSLDDDQLQKELKWIGEQDSSNAEYVKYEMEKDIDLHLQF